MEKYYGTLTCRKKIAEVLLIKKLNTSLNNRGKKVTLELLN